MRIEEHLDKDDPFQRYLIDDDQSHPLEPTNTNYLLLLAANLIQKVIHDNPTKEELVKESANKNDWFRIQMSDKILIVFRESKTIGHNKILIKANKLIHYHNKITCSQQTHRGWRRRPADNKTDGHPSSLWCFA